MSFLSPDKIDVLDKMFNFASVGGKCYVPIGLQELKLSKIEKRETKRKGLYMYVVEMWKPPVEISFRVDKVSFKPIQCFHILTAKTNGNFAKSWFKPLTNNLKEEDFIKLKQKEGSFFKALIKHIDSETMLPDKNYENKYRRVKFIKPEVLSVYSLDAEVEVNYWKLHKLPTD